MAGQRLRVHLGSVSEGTSRQIVRSDFDAVLDALLAEDPAARVACEPSPPPAPSSSAVRSG